MFIKRPRIILFLFLIPFLPLATCAPDRLACSAPEFRYSRTVSIRQNRKPRTAGKNWLLHVQPWRRLTGCPGYSTYVQRLQFCLEKIKIALLTARTGSWIGAHASTQR
ncbi:Uncharacterized protein HZ326_6470 [Fusarium oxysporum f. sp. albedinis]|nr:Uncharacterized protein HZ326_6470 [Fusarium oxysporum f. sp. albedinis]